ncbi:MAG: GNAT family N-acetyltransferase [Thermoplasmata archaeon]|nr:GNAT family N-acetyltransferase [Thermoplasmata archaeon]
MIRISQPREKDMDQYFELRWRVLRKPWNQPRGSEIDEMDDRAIHLAAYDGDRIVAVARLHFNSEEEAQIRYMAVDERYRNRGIGSEMLKELERVAREKGAKYIVLEARENAVNFYLKNGYVIVKKSFLLFDSIQHYRMMKRL